MFVRHKFCFNHVDAETTDEILVIRDADIPGCRSITNDAEAVVEYLHSVGELPAGRLLHYYDTDGNKDELQHDGKGKFTGFNFLPRS